MRCNRRIGEIITQAQYVFNGHAIAELCTCRLLVERVIIGATYGSADVIRIRHVGIAYCREAGIDEWHLGIEEFLNVDGQPLDVFVLGC